VPPPRPATRPQDRCEDGQYQQGQERLAHPQPGREGAVRDTRRREPDGGQHRCGDRQPRRVQAGTEEENDAGEEHELEDEELERHGRGLAQEDARRVEAREP